jgi:MoaA/NifB/PqqE/SkfB family radical SAM enzyme
MLRSIDECLQDIHDQFEVLDQIRCDYNDVELAKLDLYMRLQKVWREQFDTNQRIVFVLERDFYNDHSPAGALLQAIQIIVQDIDISNFFVCIVSSNADLASEYSYVKQNISWDEISFNCYACSGSFARLTHDHRSMDGKGQSLKHLTDDISALSDPHRQMLFQDPVFCMMPWVGVNIGANSRMRPCCEWQGPNIGDPEQQSIKEIWNGKEIKQIRRQMLQGQPVSGCASCYNKEKLTRDSLRNSINRDFVHRVDLIDRTDPDGTLHSDTVLYWDIRYNNLCNFACRSCGPHSSSSWAAVHNALHPDHKQKQWLLEAGSDSDHVFAQITEHLHSVEKIYFAGGEPLMIENFYRVLDLLDQAGRHDVQLCYNTNLSRLTLRGWSILELWSKFSRVSVGASIDAMEARAEYLRSGTRWSDIVSNRRLIQQHCPHVDFYVSATTGLINALHVADFHQSWVDQDLISAGDFNIQLLFQPTYMSVRNAPERLRQQIVDRYTQHIEWLRPRDQSGRAVSGFRSVIEMCRRPDVYDREQFCHEIGRLDQYHGTDLFRTFPELIGTGL